MKSSLRKLFAFILTPLEAGDEPIHYKPSHRKILYVMSGLLWGLILLMFVFSAGNIMNYLLPFVVFGVGAALCLLVAALGTDRAVAKIWGGSRK